MRPSPDDEFRWAYSTALQVGMRLFTEGSIRKIADVQIQKKRSGIQARVECKDGTRLFLCAKDRVAILIEKDLAGPKGPNEIREEKSKCDITETNGWLQRQLRYND